MMQQKSAGAREWLNVVEAADYLGVSKDIIYEAAKKLGLKFVRLAGRKDSRFHRKWLDDWMESYATQNFADLSRQADLKSRKRA